MSKLETEPLVANSNRTSSELSETNDKNSDISEPDLPDGNTLVNNTNSTISASISHFNTDNDVKLLNNTSAQTLVENNSQNSVELTSGQEIQQNGDQTDSPNQLIAENDELGLLIMMNIWYLYLFECFGEHWFELIKSY